ncbi:MAG: outer membrane beta-barrel protein [Microscillaceae bacterium]|nr:outer membrane beta-barrel protein [Microscillaceae bacterium]
MKKNFDDRLKNKIKSLFDEHQEAYQPAHWELLKTRIEEKKRKRILLWWQNAKIAAILIPACLLAGWYFISLRHTPSPKILSQQKPLVEDIQQDSFAQNQGASPKIQDQKSSSSTQTLSPQKPALIPPVIANKQTNQLGQNPDNLMHTQTREGELYTQSARNVQAIEPLKTNLNLLFSLDQDAFLNKALAKMENDLADFYSLNNPWMSHHLKDTQTPEFSDKNNIQYGLGLTSMYNYTQNGGKSSLNYGGSVGADFPVSKRLSVSSGIMLSKQSFTLDEPSDVFTRTVGQSNIEDFKATDVDLLALDIPVNVSYRFELPEDKSISLSAGFSSLVYIKEDFTSSFTASSVESVFDASTGSFNNVTKVVEFQQVDSPQSFSRFDFARLLNISVGLTYPLSPHIRLQVEPYLKYPLGQLTQQNLKFGMGGIQLRLNFGK